MKWIRGYLDRNPTSECWVSPEASPVVTADAYGIPCKPLLNGFSRMIGQPVAPLPNTISGTIFIGTTDITGFHWGPGLLNPYAAFRDREPDAILQNDIWVYHGSSDISLLAALNNSLMAQALLLRQQPTAALALAKTAFAQYPRSADVQLVLAEALKASGQTAESQIAMAKALQLAKETEPDYQQALIDQIQHPAHHQ